MLYDFSDRTIVDTGSAGVLAIELVRTLADCIANIVALSRGHEASNRLAQRILSFVI